MINWDAIKQEFAWNGSLRDIYIVPATLEDWAALWPMLRGYPGAEFSVDGLRQPPPATVQTVFALRPSASPKLRLKAGSVGLTFHFFSTKEIECDFDPREAASQSNLNALLEFVREMGERTGKPTVITPENCPEEAFIAYDPATREFQVMPTGA